MIKPGHRQNGTPMNTTRRLLLAGGIANVCVGITHFLMPQDLATQHEFAALSASGLSLLVLLILATGLCITVFGSLCLFVAQAADIPQRVVGAIALSQSVLWLGRFLLELALPVTIPLAGIGNPTVFVLPLALTLSTLFFAAYLTSKRASL